MLSRAQDEDRKPPIRFRGMEVLASCSSEKWRQKLDGGALRSGWEVRNGNKFSKERRKNRELRKCFTFVELVLPF